MTRIKRFLAVVAMTAALPTAAAAQCGTLQGSFAVTCERGVQVYRHQALSGMPAPLSQAESNLKAEQLRQETARARIQAQARANARAAKLRERELALEDYRARVFDRTARRTSFPIGAFGAGGYQFAQPVRVRSGSLKPIY